MNFGDITAASVGARKVTAERVKTFVNYYNDEVTVKWEFDEVDGFSHTRARVPAVDG